MIKKVWMAVWFGIGWLAGHIYAVYGLAKAALLTGFEAGVK
jgi:hypothetical protein